MTDSVQIEGKKQTPHNIIIGIGIATAALIFTFVLFFTGNKPTVYTIKGGIFDISTQYGQAISISDIQSIELKDTVPAKLRRTNGYGFVHHYQGSLLIRYRYCDGLYRHLKPPFIYLTTANGLIIIFNDETAEKTHALYEDLQKAIE
jgi:hypothetical protein